jgi:hypothetical protein
MGLFNDHLEMDISVDHIRG